MKRYKARTNRVGLVAQFPKGSSPFHLASLFESFDVLGHFSVRISLDEELEGASLGFPE